MKPLFYLMRKSFKNHIKQLKRKPAALIGYICFAFIMVAAIINSGGSSSPNKQYFTNCRFGFIIGGILTTFFYLTIKEGINRGSSFFTIADINLVFTSPTSSKKVLIYGILKQLYRTVIMVFFVLIQIPNMKNWFNMKSYGAAIIILGSFIFMFILTILSILIYSIASRSNKSRDIVKKIVGALGVIFIAILLIKGVKTKNIAETGEFIFNHKYFSYIPILGWTKEVLMAAVVGINTRFFIYLTIDVVSIFMIIFVIYNVNTDYYEDVLGATEYKEKLIKNKKEGKNQSFNFKVRKIKQNHIGSGGTAIFYRQLLEYRKSGFFFIDIRTVSMVISGLVFAFCVGETNINLVLYFSIYMLLFFSLQGKWSQEIKKPYIFLIPVSSFKKVFYTTLADHIKNFIDGYVLFTVVGIKVKENPLTILLCAIAYASFGMIYIYCDILARRIFKLESKTLESALKIILAIFVVGPGIGISAYISITAGQAYYAKYLMYGILIVYNLIISGVILILNKGIFERLEMD